MFRDRSQWVVVGGGAVGVMLLAFVLAFAQPQGGAQGNGLNGGPPNGSGGPNGNGSHGHHNGSDNGGPVYQRHAGEWKNRGDWRRDGSAGRPWMTPQVSSNWFQRPYPYHLDYYKMRWGGSYAPYFGNLYGVPFGTPQVVNGGWGFGPGGWGEGANPPPPGYEWMDGPPSGGDTPSANAVEKPATDSNSAATKTGSQSTGGENLPAPVK